MSLIIDSHVHVGAQRHWIPEALDVARQLADDDTRVALDGDGPTGRAVADYLRGQGVHGAIAIPSGRDPVQEYTLDEGERSDGFLHPLVQYDPRSVTRARQRFAKAIENGAVGLKVHPASHELPANDRSLYPLYALAEERQVPVMVHVGSSVFPGAKMRLCDPLLVDEVAADFPDLPIICAHAGRGFWTDQVFFLTRMRSNIWLELSGWPADRIPAAFPELDRIASRVLFGSDWPSSPGVGRLVEDFRSLPYEATTIDAALGGNAASLFGLTA